MISKYILKLEDTHILYPDDKIPATTENIVRLAREFYQGRDREIGLVMGVDAESNIALMSITAVGTLFYHQFYPREIFKPLILGDCAGGIVLHNHPFGDSKPSEGDVIYHKMIKAQGVLINIPIRDNIIIGENDYYSFAEFGIPPKEEYKGH